MLAPCLTIVWVVINLTSDLVLLALTRIVSFSVKCWVLRPFSWWVLVPSTRQFVSGTDDEPTQYQDVIKHYLIYIRLGHTTPLLPHIIIIPDHLSDDLLMFCFSGYLGLKLIPNLSTVSFRSPTCRWFRWTLQSLRGSILIHPEKAELWEKKLVIFRIHSF